MACFAAAVGALWALVLLRNRRRIALFLTGVEVRHADYGGARVNHPTAKMAAGGRWAVWPVWDPPSGTVVRFQKRRFGWKTPVQESTLEEFNEYRRANGEEEFPATIQAHATVAGRNMLLAEIGIVAYASLFDQQLNTMTAEYEDEWRLFWRRRIPALCGGVVAVSIVAVQSYGNTGLLWAVPVVVAALGLLLAITAGIPRRPTRADAAMMVLLQLHLERDRRATEPERREPS
jgi:hypothetical protein